jgi:tripartite-type tricarboxylate transporter receptor subunit TctC
MTQTTRRAAIGLLGAGSALASFAILRAAQAQEAYPSRPVRVIVPFVAGGGTDDFARRFTPHIGGGIGERVFVENRAGGNTLLATEIAVRARPDGYTLLQQTNNFTVNPYLHEKLSFDTLRDFAPISLVARAPHLLVVNNDVPARNVGELIALAKARPGALNFGTSGVGTTNHLAAEMFQKLAGIRLEHVPYRGASEYTNDLLGGRIQMVFAGAAQAIPQAQAGTMRGLGITGKLRAPDLPNVPTMEEAGLAGFEIYSWHGYLAPAATPAPILAKLEQEIRAAALNPRVQAMIPTTEFLGSTAAEFAEFLRRDYARVGELLQNLGTVRNN